MKRIFSKKVEKTAYSYIHDASMDEINHLARFVEENIGAKYKIYNKPNGTGSIRILDITEEDAEKINKALESRDPWGPYDTQGKAMKIIWNEGLLNKETGAEAARQLQKALGEVSPESIIDGIFSKMRQLTSDDTYILNQLYWITAAMKGEGWASMTIADKVYKKLNDQYKNEPDENRCHDIILTLKHMMYYSPPSLPQYVIEELLMHPSYYECQKISPQDMNQYDRWQEWKSQEDQYPDLPPNNFPGTDQNPTLDNRRWDIVKQRKEREKLEQNKVSKSMKQIFSKKSKTKGPDKAYPICMDSIQGTEGPKADWDEHAEDKFDRCVEKVKEDSKDMKDPCWKGYEMVGMKEKNGKEVPNCVPEESKDMKDPCWKGYEQVGMKEKNGREVPNCVPKKSNTYFSIFKYAQNGQQYDLQDDGLAEKMQQFEQIVAGHDLTYHYSDDSRAYSKGSAERKKILELAKELPEDDAKRIWNAYVDKKLIPDARDQFYWR